MKGSTGWKGGLILVNDWKKALLLSFISYLGILFVIIVGDTFYNKDFDFPRVLRMTAAYVAVLVVYFSLMFAVFRSRLD